MSLLYQLSIILYGLLIRLASLFSHKAKLFTAGRSGLFASMKQAMNNEHRPIAWFHCASLGEFEQGRPVIEAFREQMPHYAVVLTFFSPSGYEVRKNYAKADYVWYLPLDTKSNARQFVEILSPKVAFFVKYEFWYFFLKELHGRGIPVISFSAIFRESQPFFKWWGSLHRSMLHCFSHLFVQQEASKQLLKSIGMNHVSVCPDTRFDRVWAIANQASAIPIAEDFVKGAAHTLVLGSAWVSDIEVLAPVLRDADLKLIIAPHEIDEANIEKIVRLLKGRKIVRYSKAQNVEQYNTLIIDNIGMLSSLYQYGKMAYIGGGFEKGLHNTLEAAVYGIPLMIGPKYEKFQEAIDLVLLGAAFSVSNSAEAGKTIAQFLMDEHKRTHGGTLARKYVQQHLGGTQKIMGFAKKYLKE